MIIFDCIYCNIKVRKSDHDYFTHICHKCETQYIAVQTIALIEISKMIDNIEYAVQIYPSMYANIKYSIFVGENSIVNSEEYAWFFPEQARQLLDKIHVLKAFV